MVIAMFLQSAARKADGHLPRAAVEPSVGNGRALIGMLLSNETLERSRETYPVQFSNTAHIVLARETFP